MVKVSPSHLFNQEILLISGGISFDEYGEQTYSHVVVSSGSARLQIKDERVVTTAGIVTVTDVRAYIDPTVSGTIGQLVEIDGQQFKINAVRKMVDGRGLGRLNLLILDEVTE